MPTSRKRKQKTSPRAARRPSFDPRRAEASRWMSVLLEADDAELRGDADHALDLMTRHLFDESGRLFWREERLRRLVQLVALAPVLPTWATSRWVVAQAAQRLDPDTREAHRLAVEKAMATRGLGEHARARQAAWSPDDVTIDVIDHDWIHHQLLLFDHGVLQHFVRHVATPDLLAGADDLEQWAQAPMHGFALVEQDPATIRWHDLTTDDDVVTPNLGAAAMLGAGEHVIGRLVPTGDTWLFESEPLGVPEQTAVRVAADPGAWLDAVAAVTGPDVAEPDQVPTDAFDFSLLSDIPRIIQLIAARAASRSRHPVNPFLRQPPQEWDELEGRVDLVREAVDRQDAGKPGPAVRSAPLVAAQLVEPAVLDALGDDLTSTELQRVREYAATLAAPARDAVEHVHASASLAS